MSEIVGWIIWVFDAYLALAFAYGCRRYATRDVGFQLATGVQTLFWWVIAIVFLLTPWNKLHIIWLLPLGFFSAQLIALGSIPVISPIVLFVTRLFLLGVKRS